MNDSGLVHPLFLDWIDCRLNQESLKFLFRAGRSKAMVTGADRMSAGLTASDGQRVFSG